jgi:N-acetylmuramoyl-L-alanine amidase
LSKLKTSGIAALLAFGTMSLLIAYTQMPSRMEGQPERPLPFAQIAPAPSADSASGQAQPTPTQAALLPEAVVTDAVITDATTAEALATESSVQSRGLIFLDPGHQRRGNSQQEPVSPGSRETKARVTGGTTGVVTGKPEYVLNLEIALLVKQALIQKGFEVQMTREDHDVDISNVERAEMANTANAQLAVRIHADGNVSRKAKGFSVLYPDAGVKATQDIQPASRQAAESILEALKAGTDTASRGMVARSDLSGFNWSKVPVVLIELGFMTNPTEDEWMSDPDYQQQMATAIAEGIDTYMRNK